MTRREMMRAMFIVAAALPLAACSAGKPGGAQEIKMAPLGDLPAEVQSGPATLREAYQFALANPDVLKQIPCYCGCGGVGHTSNYSCYIKDDTNGKIVFDQHAEGCSICVDITQDSMRLLKQGKSVAQIKAEVDKTYSQYGPSNMEE